jgi:hypothetical protein
MTTGECREESSKLAAVFLSGVCWECGVVRVCCLCWSAAASKSLATNKDLPLFSLTSQQIPISFGVLSMAWLGVFAVVFAQRHCGIAVGWFGLSALVQVELGSWREH